MTGLDRMLYMSSTADSSGSAAVTLTFAPGTDPDLAWAKVQNKLQLALPVLPDVVQSRGLTVSKSTRNYLLIVGLTSDDPQHRPGRPRDYVVSKVETVLARVPGVGEVADLRHRLRDAHLARPGQAHEVRDDRRDDVIAAVRAYNVEVSAGQFGGAPAVPGQRLNASILVQSLLVTPEEFAAIPLRTNPDGSVVRVQRRRPDRARDRAARHQGPVQRAARRPCSRSGRRRARTPSTPPTGIKAAMDGPLEVLPAGHEGHLPDGHDALRAGRHRRGRQDAHRGDRPRLPGHVPLPREPAGDAHPDDRRAGRAPRHLRRPRRRSATRSTC